MTDINPNALRFQPNLLEFDPTGLYVYEPSRHLGPDLRHVCNHHGLNLPVNESGHGWWKELYLSAADASTRDRLARYCVIRQYSFFRLRDEDIGTAPYFAFTENESAPTWILVVAGRIQVWSPHPNRGETLSTLAGIPQEPGHAEWAALVAIGKHLGGDRGERGPGHGAGDGLAPRSEAGGADV